MQLKNTVMFLNESSQVECLCWLEKPALTEVDKVESESESESSVVSVVCSPSPSSLAQARNSLAAAGQGLAAGSTAAPNFQFI